MSDEIPKAPITYRFYSWIRGIISPILTAQYLLIESIIVAAVSSIFLFYQFDANILIIGILLLSILVLGSIFFVSNRAEKRNDPDHVMDLSIPIYFVLSFAGVGSLYYLSYYLEIIGINTYISIGIIATYSLVQMNRGRKFFGDRENYTDEYSEANVRWKRSSVALEQALSNNDKDNERRAYFWAKRAESLYESLVEEEDRIMPREAASAYSSASGFAAASVFTEGNHSYKLWKAAETSIGRAQELLSKRVCDNCGRKEDVTKCKGVKSDDGRVILCPRCYQKKKATASKSSESSTTQESRTKTKTDDSQKSDRSRNRSSSSSTANSSTGKSRSRSNKSRSDSSATSRGSSSSNSSSNSNYNNNRTTSDESKDQTEVHKSSKSSITADEALEVLELEEARSTSQVHEAFRSRVKDAHPDMGGSEEEFKKVKRAREILLDRV